MGELDDTHTVEEIVLGLAVSEGMCRHCNGKGRLVLYEGSVEIDMGAKCRPCHGTGQVAEFPMLWGPCPCIAGDERCEGCLVGDAQVIAILGPTAPPAHPDRYCKPPCIPCQGRGCVLVITTDALLEAGKPFGIKLEWVELGSFGPETWLASAWARHPHRQVFGRSSLLDNETPDPRKALARALEAARAQEVPDASPAS